MVSAVFGLEEKKEAPLKLLGGVIMRAPVICGWSWLLRSFYIGFFTFFSCRLFLSSRAGCCDHLSAFHLGKKTTGSNAVAQQISEKQKHKPEGLDEFVKLRVKLTEGVSVCVSVSVGVAIEGVRVSVELGDADGVPKFVFFWGLLCYHNALPYVWSGLS